MADNQPSDQTTIPPAADMTTDTPPLAAAAVTPHPPEPHHGSIASELLSAVAELNKDQGEDPSNVGAATSTESLVTANLPPPPPPSAVIPYEETLPLLQKSYFPNFKIYSETTVLDAIVLIPDEAQYIVSPFPHSGPKQVPEDKQRKPTRAEKALQNRDAKTLLMLDSRKASALADYVKQLFQRVLVPIEDLSTNNCLYEAVWSQISNKDYMFDTSSGEEYTPHSLRLQTVLHMAINYEFIYPQVEAYLEGCSFKEWLTNQTKPETFGDMASIVGLRNLLEVS